MPAAGPDFHQQVHDLIADMEQRVAGLDLSHYPDSPFVRDLSNSLTQGLNEAKQTETQILNAQQFQGLVDRLKKIQQDMDQARVALALDSILQSQIAGLKRTLAALPETEIRQDGALSGEYDSLRKQVGDLEALTSGFRREEDISDAEKTLASLQKKVQAFELRVAQERGGPAVSAPSTAEERKIHEDLRQLLREAFAAYFRGDMDRASRLALTIEPAAANHPYFHLLKGVLTWQEFYLSGSDDRFQLDLAATFFRKAKKLGLPGTAVSLKYFPPKLVAFFQEVR